MSDLLALCYRRNNEAEARRLFADACNSMQRIKSIPLTDRYESDGFLVARFASPFAHAPKVMRFCDDKIILAAAGWYQSKTNRGEKSELAAVAEEYVSGKPEADVFSSLQGQYACTLLDLRQGRLLGWIDRVGLMPGYVTSADGMSWFSTSAIVLASVTKPRLDMHAVRTLFMGRCPNSPRSIFDGITKLGFGEHVELKQGSYKIERTWSPYLATVEYRNLDEAITEGVRKIHACSERVRNSYSRPIMDFTAGLDSRLVVSSFFNGSGERLSVTVSGVPESIDVQIAHLAAKQFGWEIIWMQPNTDGSARRWAAFQRGVALSEGELSGDRIEGTLGVKQAIYNAGGVSVTGGGGEMYREFFWQQEFLRIGKTTELNIPRLLKYRFDFGGSYEKPLFSRDWYPEFLANEVATIEQITGMSPDALNTAKLDAIYIWKTAAHVGRYAAAVMPVVFSISPLLTQELIDFAVSVPWRYRLHGRLIRGLITRMNPELAKVPTWYGSSAEPLSILRSLQLTKHLSNSAQTLIRKVGQLTIGRNIFRDPAKLQQDNTAEIELTRVMKDEGLLNPSNLVSAGLYSPKGLTSFLREAQEPTFTRHKQLQVLVSVELVSRLAGIEAFLAA